MIHSEKFIFAFAALALTAGCERGTVLTPDDIVPSSHAYLKAPVSVEAASRTAPSGFGYEVVDPVAATPAPAAIEYVTIEPDYAPDEAAPVETMSLESETTPIESGIIYEDVPLAASPEYLEPEYAETAPELTYTEAPSMIVEQPVFNEPVQVETYQAPTPPSQQLTSPSQQQSGSYGAAF